MPRTNHTLWGLASLCDIARVLLVVGGGWAVCQPAQAGVTPEQSIYRAVDQLLVEFNLHRSELEQDPPALYRLVDRLTRPYFDFDRIAKLVLAQNWKTASETQRREFGEQFRQLLIRTYATALFQYDGSGTIQFKTTRVKERGGFQFATVESEVVLGGAPIAVDYSMILDPQDQWKIYNVVIAGVNMVTNYRKVYGASIRQLGLDGLISAMRQANEVNPIR